MSELLTWFDSKTRQYVIALLLVLGVSGVCYLLSGFIGYRVIALVLLLVVSVIAVSYDILPVLMAAFLSAMIWNYFFIPPIHNFNISRSEDLILLIMYFVIAMINAVLTYKIRKAENKAREKEEKANTVKLYSTLLNSLSHELRTPIAAIIGATDNLQSANSHLTSSHKDELVAEISKAALRLDRQVGNLLDMSRIESGFIQSKRDWVDISETIHDLVHKLEEGGIYQRININISPGIPLFKTDSVMLEQILSNLLNNAVLYGHAEGTVSVTALSVPVGAGQNAPGNNGINSNEILPTNIINKNQSSHSISNLRLIVEDNGPGFPDSELPFIFEKFYRLKNSKAGGTGLGLSIVKGFTEALRGKIKIENVAGSGARFTIDIPCEISYLKINNE